jgi:hypothetical protein
MKSIRTITKKIRPYRQYYRQLTDCLAMFRESYHSLQLHWYQNEDWDRLTRVCTVINKLVEYIDALDPPPTISISPLRWFSLQSDELNLLALPIVIFLFRALISHPEGRIHGLALRFRAKLMDAAPQPPESISSPF